MNKEDAIKAVEAFATQLEQKISSTLSSVIIYGSLVKGDYKPGVSDINVAIILKEDCADTLNKIAETMRSHRPSRNTGLMIITTEETRRACDVFALKFREIHRYHKVIKGAPLSEMSFQKRHIIDNCEFQIRSLIIRLRKLFIQGNQSPEKLRTFMTGSFKVLLPAISSLVEEKTGTQSTTKAEIIKAAAGLNENAETVLNKILGWYNNPQKVPPISDIQSTLDDYEALMKKFAEVADQLER